MVCPTHHGRKRIKGQFGVRAAQGKDDHYPPPSHCLITDVHHSADAAAAVEDAVDRRRRGLAAVRTTL